MNGFRYNLFDGLTDHFTLSEQTDYLNIYNPNFVESLILLYCCFFILITFRSILLIPDWLMTSVLNFFFTIEGNLGLIPLVG